MGAMPRPPVTAAKQNNRNNSDIYNDILKIRNKIDQELRYG